MIATDTAFRLKSQDVIQQSVYSFAFVNAYKIVTYMNNADTFKMYFKDNI